MKNPRLDRGPKLNSAITHPQMMITSGVRQPTEAGPRLPAGRAIRFLDAWRPAGRDQPDAPGGVNAFAWKSQGRPGYFFHCRAALQNRRVQFGWWDRGHGPRYQLVVPALSRNDIDRASPTVSRSPVRPSFGRLRRAWRKFAPSRRPCPSSARRCRRPSCGGGRRCARRSCTSSSSR